MSLSVIPSAFPEPIWPDFYCCDKFYAEPSPARLSDCKQAFNLLPNGSSLIPWPMHAHREDPHFLPYILKHDTCSIQFQASGPSAEDLEVVYFTGDDMRNMAGWLIDKCISDANLGGFATYGFANAEDHITGPTIRHEDKWPAHTTFFSLQVWNNDDGHYYWGWNPGDMDVDVADDVVASLDVATDQYPRGSAAQANILRNMDYYQAVQHRMKAFYYNNWWQWKPSWGPPPLVARPDAYATSNVNPTIAIPNVTTT